MNHLFIRSDATISMGSGHMMRCIALAQAWKKRGGFVTFISHCPNETITKRLDSEGFNLIRIKEICPHSQDLETTLNILYNHFSSIEKQISDTRHWIVLDGYHFTPDYQKSLMAKGFKLLVIDDYNHLDHYHATLLLNQNIGSDQYTYSCPDDTINPDGTIKLLGTKYIMLRSEFLLAKQTKKNASTKNILVTLGGSDPDNTTAIVLNALKKITDPIIQFKIILGPDNPNTAHLKDTYKNSDSNFEFIENADMPKIMAWADMALTAGGSTCWELCFMAVPFIIIIIAPNQLKLACALEHKGAAVCIGEKESLTPEKITNSIAMMIHNHKKLEAIKDIETRLVDGKGLKRIIRAMVAGKIILRSANINDTKQLYEWANDKETRAVSFKPDPISWEEHLTWFKRKLTDQNSWIYIAHNHTGDDIGQIRFDQTDELFNISYLLDKKFRRLGLGKSILKAGIKKIRSTIQQPAQLVGKIKTDNVASIKSFENCGFSLLKKKDATGKILDHCVYQLILNPMKVTDQP